MVGARRQDLSFSGAFFRMSHELFGDAIARARPVFEPSVKSNGILKI